jgi:hypothetical protein
MFIDKNGLYPTKPTEVFAYFGIELPPLAGGILDGAYDASPAGMATMVSRLIIDSEYRAEMLEGLKAIVSDPAAAVEKMFTDYKETYERLLSGEGTDEDYQKFGEEIGGSVVGMFTGGTFLRQVKKLFKPKAPKGVKVDMPNSKKSRKVPCDCFAKGTQVKTENGEKPVEEIKKGDWVWAEDPVTGKIELKQVTATYIIPEKKKLFHIFVSADTLKATGTHPFWTTSGWKNAAELQTQDSLKLRTGQWVIIDSIGTEKGNFTTYNFTVEGFHTYFVGESGVLVHNCEGADALAKFKSNLPNKFKGIDKKHLNAAIGDMKGNPIVIGGKVYDHLDDITGHMRGLNGKIRELQKLIDKGGFSGSVLEEAQALRSRLQKTYDFYQGVLQKAASKTGTNIDIKKK